MNVIKQQGIRKLLELGFANIIWSILPIVFWYLIGLLWGTEYKNGFIIGYSTQFIVMCLQGIFLWGSLKSWVAGNKKINYFGMGLICYLVTGLIFCIILSLFGKYLLPFFGYHSVVIQKLYIVYMWQFVIDGIVMGIHTYFQYQERRRLSQILSYLWFVIRLMSLFVCKIFYKDDCLSALYAANMFLLMLSIILIIICVDFKDIKFDLRNWVSRESYDISSHFVMFIIYFLGVGDMSSNITFLAAYNTMTMYTDIQWDLENSIDTYVATEAADGDWTSKKKHVFKSVMVYSVLLFLSSLLCILLFGNQIVFYIWLIEMILYIPDCIGIYYLSYVSIKAPSKWMCIFGLANKIIRLCVQLLIVSLWSIPISCFVGCLLFVLGSVFLYYKSQLRE